MDSLADYSSSESQSSGSSAAPSPSEYVRRKRPPEAHADVMEPAKGRRRRVAHRGTARISTRQDVLTAIPSPVFGGDGGVVPTRTDPAAFEMNKYPVFVYVPVQNSAGDLSMRAFINRLHARARLALVNKPRKVTLFPVHSLHISLSRPVFVRREQIRRLLQSINAELRPIKRSSFRLAEKLIALPSQNQTRTYLASPVHGADNSIVPLIRVIDNVMTSMRLPGFYDRPLPHLSFAWAEGNELVSLFSTLQHDAQTTPCDAELVACMTCNLNSVCCRIGNRTYMMNM